MSWAHTSKGDLCLEFGAREVGAPTAESPTEAGPQRDASSVKKGKRKTLVQRRDNKENCLRVSRIEEDAHKK